MQRFFHDFDSVSFRRCDLRIVASMPREKKDLSLKSTVRQPTESSDSVWSIVPQIDVEYGDFCAEHFLGLVLELHQIAEAHTFHSQRGFKKDRHQLPEIFAVIKKHNSRRPCHLRSV